MSEGDKGERQSAMVALSPKELFDKASKLFEENDFEGAIRFYSAAIQMKPDYSSAYFNRALSWAVLGKYGEAKKDIEKAAEIEPIAADIPYVKGLILEYEGNYQAAKEWYEKSLALGPKYELAKNRLHSLVEREARIRVDIEKMDEDLIQGLFVLIQAEKATLALPWLSLDDIHEASDFIEQLELRENHMRNLVIAEIAPRIAVRYLNWNKLDEAKKFMTYAFEASQESNTEVFRQNKALRTLLFYLVGSLDYSSSQEGDVNKAFALWQAKLKRRIEAVDYSFKFVRWLSEGTQIDDGQNIIDQALVNLTLDIQDDFLESRLYYFEESSLELQVLKKGPTEDLREAFKDLWHKVETRLASVSKNVAGGIFEDYLLLSSPADLGLLQELNKHSDLLTSNHRMLVFGYWSLIDRAYIEEFKAAMKDCACVSSESMAKSALLLFLGRVIPTKALKEGLRETGLNGDLVKAVINQQPIKGVLKANLEKNSFMQSENELVRKLLDKDDEDALVWLALMRWSNGTLALLLKTLLDRDDPSPVVMTGLDYGGMWRVVYKNMEEALKRYGPNDLNILKDALMKIVFV